MQDRGGVPIPREISELGLWLWGHGQCWGQDGPGFSSLSNSMIQLLMAQSKFGVRKVSVALSGQPLVLFSCPALRAGAATKLQSLSHRGCVCKGQL